MAGSSAKRRRAILRKAQGDIALSGLLFSEGVASLWKSYAPENRGK
jgi:hypothetical protein